MLIGTASLPDMQKIRIIRCFSENMLHWQFEVGGGGNCYKRLFQATYLFIIIIFIYCNWVVTGDSGYFTCKQNMKLVTTRFKSGGLHEKHVVATWNVGNRLSICL